MTIIYTHQRSKPKKKPGWQQKQAEYDAWLKGVKGMTTNFSARNRGQVKKAEPPTTTSVGTTSTFLKKDFSAFKGGGTVTVRRPEIEYADDPEMLERELQARARRFNVAPAYNKGPDILVTEEEITKQLVGGRRR